MKLKLREKLQKEGLTSMEDAELLAILLNVGSSKEAVLAMSSRIISGYGRTEIIYCSDPIELQNRLHIGFAQASKIVAAMELYKRLFLNTVVSKYIKSSEDVFSMLKNMQYLSKEHLRGLYLNSRNKVIHEEIISIGTIDASLIHPREVFKTAIEVNANSIILAHNHPSGDSEPSAADIHVTSQLTKIGDLIQIPLLDHIIIGRDKYFSFKDARHL